jgi:hypothetical protein
MLIAVRTPDKWGFLMPIVIRGVHPVPIADEPCYLVEVEIDNTGFDWNSVTQQDARNTPQDWQVAYDEQPLDDNGTRWAFFFHHLNFDEPLLTADGPISIPKPTPIPRHLQHVEYVPP